MSDENKNKVYSVEEIAAGIMFDGVCVLNEPIHWNGQQLNGAKRIKKVLVKDRIEAVQFSKAQYGDPDIKEAIISHLASTVLRFGVIEEQEPPAPVDDKSEPQRHTLHLKGEIEVPVDQLQLMTYEDYINLTYLMGKS